MQVIGGVILGTTRASRRIKCNGRRAHLQTLCLLTGKLRLAFEQGLSGTGPFGFDPMFLRSSPLYSPGLPARQGEFYNVTEGSKELSPLNVPYGFFPRRLRKDETGFAVVFQVLFPPRLLRFLSACTLDQFSD